MSSTKAHSYVNFSTYSNRHRFLVSGQGATCRLHRINPYDYLVDVLHRVDQHPATLVEQLPPRLWREHFGADSLHADLHSYA